MDKLSIKNLEIFAYHGVFEEEKKLGQKFILSLDMYYSIQEAGMKDDLGGSIHYGILTEKIMEEFTREKYDLIETAAEKLVTYILRGYPIIREITVTVEKPWAPVHFHMAPVSITIKRRWEKVYIGMGANMGDLHKNFDSVINILSSMKEIRNLRESDRITTEPWGKTDQNEFLNSVIYFETFLEPEVLLNVLQSAETELGRIRHEKWGPRIMDLDILFYGDRIMNDDNLIIPHPYISEREFVLKPLYSLSPHYIHPVSKKSMGKLLKELEQKGISDK